MKKIMTVASLAMAIVLALGVAAYADGHFSFGQFRDHELADQSGDLFGIKKPLDESSTKSISQAEALTNLTKLATLAKGLKAKVVTSQGPTIDDQISLWPNSSNPQFLIACNETDEATEPGLVRIELSTGKLSTIRTPGGHRRYRAAEVRALLRANTTQAGTDSATTPDPDLRGPATHSEPEMTCVSLRGGFDRHRRW